MLFKCSKSNLSFVSVPSEYYQKARESLEKIIKIGDYTKLVLG